MDLLPLAAGIGLLTVGVAFAFFLGIASSRIEAERARDLAAFEREHGIAPGAH